MEKENLGLKFEQKEIKEDEKLPPLCPDYEPDDYGRCEKGGLCKNATYGSKDEPFGSCYGGTKSSEREHRNEFKKKYCLAQGMS